MAKKRTKSQTARLEKFKIDPKYLVAKGVRHTIGKFLIRTTTLLRLYLNLRFARKVIALQNCGNPNLSDFETPTWESQDKKPFGCGLCGQPQSIL
jgi:hypothetical protein